MEAWRVKVVVREAFAVAAEHVKKTGRFKLMRCIDMQRRVVPEKPAKRGEHPFTKQSVIHHHKPTHYLVTIKPMKKLQDMVKGPLPEASVKRPAPAPEASCESNP